ncbi:hypothetical protein AA313_de0207255 [Arthrobotrys entomopaga]|nr:hypothetical protein AA313_de0207255 [Arthrobotrys entomopaga]
MVHFPRPRFHQFLETISHLQRDEEGNFRTCYTLPYEAYGECPGIRNIPRLILDDTLLHPADTFISKDGTDDKQIDLLPEFSFVSRHHPRHFDLIPLNSVHDCNPTVGSFLESLAAVARDGNRNLADDPIDWTGRDFVVAPGAVLKRYTRISVRGSDNDPIDDNGHEIREVPVNSEGVDLMILSFGLHIMSHCSRTERTKTGINENDDEEYQDEEEEEEDGNDDEMTVNPTVTEIFEKITDTVNQDTRWELGGCLERLMRRRLLSGIPA